MALADQEGQVSGTHLHRDREGVSRRAHLLIQSKDPVPNWKWGAREVSGGPCAKGGHSVGPILVRPPRFPIQSLNPGLPTLWGHPCPPTPSREEEENKHWLSSLPVWHFHHLRGWEGIKGGGPGAETHPAGQGCKRAGQSAERGAPGEKRRAGSRPECPPLWTEHSSTMVTGPLAGPQGLQGGFSGHSSVHLPGVSVRKEREREQVTDRAEGKSQRQKQGRKCLGGRWEGSRQVRRLRGTECGAKQ